MLDNSTFDTIYELISSIFDAPEKQIVVWIEKNTKYFLKLAEPISTEHVLNVVSSFFLKELWPSQMNSEFICNLEKSLVKYDWKLKKNSHLLS